MPLYEYRCCSCGHCFDVKRGYGDTSPASCPHCQGESHKVFMPVPVIYKGGGFYSTDHRPTSWKSEESEEKTTDKAEAKAEKTEARPEEKAEAKGK